MKSFFKPARPRGFALIVTLTLMILLTVIAVGLLTLSSISLRSSSQEETLAVAKSNARLALVLAIGELQKSAGSDQAVTATSEIIAANPAKRHLSGVWQSWRIDPGSSPDYDTEKDSRFQAWLVSDSDVAGTDTRDYPASVFTGETIDLVTGTGPTDRVVAGMVPTIAKGRRTGAYAWHVADEGVKARINSYRDPKINTTLAEKRALASGHRPDVSVISGLDFLPTDTNAVAYQAAAAVSGKLISLNQADRLKSRGAMEPFQHSITPYSLGLLTDAREGGLKRDLTTLLTLGGSMPSPYNNGRLYETTHGITGVSDPYWSSLASYHNLYQNLESPDTSPTISSKPSTSVNTAATNLPQPPTTFTPTPTLSRVDFVFSFIARNPYGGGRAAQAQAAGKNYTGFLVFMPVVTLHNPYNISLKFDQIDVSIKNVPVGLNFLVNGIPQNTRAVPLNDLYVTPPPGNVNARKNGKEFLMKIKSRSGSGSLTMLPGQSLVCQPSYPANAAFPDIANVDGDPVKLTNINAAPGLDRGPMGGFGIDWLVPADYSSPGYKMEYAPYNNLRGLLPLAASDSLAIEIKPTAPTLYLSPELQNRFVVSARMTQGGQSSEFTGIDLRYENEGDLTGIFPTVVSDPQPVSGMAQGSSTQLSAQTPYSFVSFSIANRVSFGGVDDTGTRNGPAAKPDGRLSGMPFLFHNPAQPVQKINLPTEKIGNYSREMSYRTLSGDFENDYPVDALDRTTSLLTIREIPGVSIKSGTLFEVPSGPLMSIADLRRSNAISSSHLPQFVQPVSNSHVSPLMSTNRVIESGSAGYDLLDHSYLANHALYDGFYFSTLADSGSNSASAAFEDFIRGARPLANQSFEPYLHSGQSVEDAKTELFSGSSPTPDAFQKAAGYLMARGAFNVNSTNVNAWKAVLSSLNKTDLPTLLALSGAVDEITPSNPPITAMSLMNGGLATGTPPAEAGDAATNQWNGHRELDPTQLDALANQIVNQVRDRGPFLSMSEFVNRRIGGNSPQTRAGAIQQAIDEANLNDPVFTQQVPIASADVSDNTLYDYKTPEASAGNPAAGAPGWITQGDVLKVIGPGATVRSDTFVIRVCGESQTGSNQKVRVYAEAVVQRVPDYVDPADPISAAPASISTINRNFGRRFSVISFRWLSSNEI